MTKDDAWDRVLARLQECNDAGMGKTVCSMWYEVQNQYTVYYFRKTFASVTDRMKLKIENVKLGTKK